MEVHKIFTDGAHTQEEASVRVLSCLPLSLAWRCGGFGFRLRLLNKANENFSGHFFSTPTSIFVWCQFKARKTEETQEKQNNEDKKAICVHGKHKAGVCWCEVVFGDDLLAWMMMF